MRKKYIDLLREIALFYMFFQHAVLVLLLRNENKGIIYFLFELVPICPALFLFVAGFSINISFNKTLEINKNQFIINLFKRGLILILSASLLFVIEYGFQLPDMLISSGILNTIGWMIIICAILLFLPNKKLLLTLFIVLLIAANYLLEIKNIYIVPFNNGYEPISPTITFGFIGFLTGLLFNGYKENIKKEKLFVLITGLIGLLLFIYFSIKYGIFKIFFYDIGRYTITRTFNSSSLLNNIFLGNVIDDSQIIVSIWNYNTQCFLVSLSVVLILFSSMYFLEKYFNKFLHENIFVPGIFAFFNYFYHLAVIAVFVIITGYNNFSLKLFLLFLSILFISSYILSYLLLKIKNNIKSKKIS